MSIKKILLALVCCVSLLAVGCGGGGGGGGGATGDVAQTTLSGTVTFPNTVARNVSAGIRSAIAMDQVSIQIEGLDLSQTFTANGGLSQAFQLTISNPSQNYYDLKVVKGSQILLQARVSNVLGNVNISGITVDVNSTAIFNLLKRIQTELQLTDYTTADIQYQLGAGLLTALVNSITAWLADINQTGALSAYAAFANDLAGIAINTFKPNEKNLRTLATQLGNDIKGTTLTIAEKVATLTANVHPDFKYSSMGANTDNLTALQNAMTNRLTDYDITGYTLTVLSTKYVDANTIEMLCNLNVSGTKKTTQAQVSKSFSNEKITWVYNTTNNLNRWQIYRGLPYNFELQ